MLFYFGIIKANFLKETELEQDLEGRGEERVGRGGDNTFQMEDTIGVKELRQQVSVMGSDLVQLKQHTREER